MLEAPRQKRRFKVMNQRNQPVAVIAADRISRTAQFPREKNYAVAPTQFSKTSISSLTLVVFKSIVHTHK